MSAIRLVLLIALVAYCAAMFWACLSSIGQLPMKQDAYTAEEILRVMALLFVPMAASYVLGATRNDGAPK